MKVPFTTRRTIVIGTVAVALAGLGGGVALATGTGDDIDDRPITGSAREQATAAALAYIEEGRVTGTEVDDEESRYEVEVTLKDGRQIDVQLDAGFDVVGTESEQHKDDG